MMIKTAKKPIMNFQLKRDVVFHCMVLFMIFAFSYKGNAQMYWESNAWKKILNNEAVDSTGFFSLYYNNGEKKVDGQFFRGVPLGKWKFYSKEGAVVIESDFNGGYIFENHSEGQLTKTTGSYIHGKPAGIWKKYIENDDSLTLFYTFNFDNDSVHVYDIYEAKLLSEKVYPSSKYIRRRNNSGGLFIDFGFGSGLVDLTSLNDFMEAQTEKRFSDLIFSYNLGISFNNLNNYFITFNYMPYETSIINIQEIREFRLGGAIYKLSGGFDLLAKDAIDISPLAGVGFNELIIVKKDKNSLDEQLAYNSAVFADIMMDVRFNIATYNNWVKTGLISFGSKFGYSYDLGNPQWKLENSFKTLKAPETDMRNFYFFIFAGFYFKNIRSL